jgi:hypothetical protein
MLYLKLDSESGMAMVVAVIATIIGTVLVGSYMTLVISESKNSVWQKQRSQASFLAEAGLEKGLYYLNNRFDDLNPWTDEHGEMLDTPPLLSEALAEGRYEVELFDQADEPWIPANTYLVRSLGVIDRENGNDIEQRASCLASRLDGLPIPASLGILDTVDPEDELLSFQSSAWTIDGSDMDGLGGLPGIAVANIGDDLASQLGSRLDQVTGSDEWGNPSQGAAAISEDLSLSTDLDSYVNYFRRIAIDVSGIGTIPDGLLGTADDFEVLYADLSQGPIKLAGTSKGSGVLILEGDGEFTMAGGSEWNGVIICAGGSNIKLTGGGGNAAHIYGALLIADGTVEMKGTADIRYSSGRMSKVNMQLVLYQVHSWSGGWGVAL